jgi:uncharacterized protein YoxC
MPVWFDIIVAMSFVGLACYARGLYIELQTTKKKLDNAKDNIKLLHDELQRTYNQYHTNE